MTNTDTRDTAACVAQIERIARAGAPIVRLTAQGGREAENLRDITERLRADGNTTALVADIHLHDRPFRLWPFRKTEPDLYKLPLCAVVKRFREV